MRVSTFIGISAAIALAGLVTANPVLMAAGASGLMAGGGMAKKDGDD